jgi:zinc protease
MPNSTFSLVLVCALAAGVPASCTPAAALPASAEARPGPPPGAAPLEFSAPWGAEDPSFRRHTLPNGLTVLTLEEHSQPLVSVLVWYRVGARNERPGITGIAHYLEHMAFRASENIQAEDITGQIERLGGHWHGYTRLDNTAYFETVRREALEWALFLEAERMQRLLMLPAEVEVERGGILSELKGYENDPWSLLYDAVAAVAFDQHPYGYNISGWVSDIEAITHADVLDFYRRYYAPANAILVLVGDFDTTKALAAVRRQFDALPRRPPLEPLRTVEPPQRGEKQVTLRMPGAAASVMVGYHAPAADDKDFFRFLQLDAILSGGRGVSTLGSEFEISPFSAERRSSRLYRDLVATGLATRVTTGLLPTLHPYLYTVTAEAAPGVSLDTLERSIIASVEGVARNPPSEEEIATARQRLQFLSQAQVDTFQGLAHFLATSEAFLKEGAQAGLKGGVLPALPEEEGEGESVRIQALARRYLNSENRTAGWFEPIQAPAGAAAPGAETAPSETSSSGKEPAAGAAASSVRRASPRPRLTPPKISLASVDPPPPPTRLILSSGLELTAATTRRRVMTGALVIEIDAGPYYDPEGGEGTAALTARLLSAGSEARDARATAALIDRLGVRWNVRVGGSDLDVADPRRVRIELQFPMGSLSGVAGLVADALRAPLFPSDAFRVARQAQASEVAGLEDDTVGLSRSRLMQALFAGSRYGRPVLGSRQIVSGLSRADLQRFHARYYRPERTRIAFCGGWPERSGASPPAGALEERSLGVLKEAYADWSLPPPEEEGREAAGAAAGGPSALPAPDSLRSPEPVRLVHKAQADLAYGFFTGVSADSPDRAALEALVYTVHHNYGGRLGDQIIMQRGLAYSIDSVQAPDLPGSPWLLHTGAPPEKVAPLQKLWEEILDEVGQRGISAKELEAARTYLEGRRLHEQESGLSAARAALAATRAGGQPPGKAAAPLTLEQVNRLARRLLSGRRALWSLAGPIP